MPDYLTIAGSQVNLQTTDTVLDHCLVYARNGIPELQFSRLVQKLAALPDTWSGQTCKWSNGSSYPGTTYFSGSIVGYTDRYEGDLGWVRQYRALGLRNLADYVPVTDSNTLSDLIQFNMAANAIDSIPSRMGRTIGQAILDVLSMSQNATALQAYGIGNYTSTGSGATATATMTTGNTLSTYGTISGLTVTNGGSGYGSTPPTVVIVGPCTTQAVYTANLTGGSVASFTQVNAGAGYTSIPQVIISTLPSATITDLAALTIISPFPLNFCGERILQSIESVMQVAHPNHWLHIDPAGNIRFLDQRSTTNYTVTLGDVSDTPMADGTLGYRWLMPRLSRDYSDCYSKLVVRGALNVTGIYLSLSPQKDSNMNITYTGPLMGTANTGGLVEDFAFGSYTSNSDAKAHWVPNDYVTQSLQGGQDQGSCTCSSTTSVVITSSNTALTLASDVLDQNAGSLHAVLTVIQYVVAGSEQMFTTSVIANTAMSAGGTSTLTVAPPLPATTYTSYFLTFSNQAGNVVWRQYKAVDPAIGAALQNYFPYPFAYRNWDKTAAAMTSAAMGMVLWSASGSPPYNESDFSVTVNPEAGTITFPRPTSLVYGGGIVTPPSDIAVFVPVANGALEVHAPSSGYAGTLYTVEGVERTKTITLRDWTQVTGTNINIQTFCDEQFDSIKDVVVEGSLDYVGLAATYLTPGTSVSITGENYTTGFETLQTSPMPAGLPVSACEVQFNWGSTGPSYITTLRLSNRKARYSGDIFLRPSVVGQAFGGEFGAGYLEAWRQGTAGFHEFEQGAASEIMSTIGGLGESARNSLAGQGENIQAGVSGIGEPIMAGINAVGSPVQTRISEMLAGVGVGVGDGGGREAGPTMPTMPTEPLEQIKLRQEVPETVKMPTHPQAGLGQGPSQ